MSVPSSPHRFVAGILAVLGPLAILGGVFAWLHHPEQDTASKGAQEITARLAKAPPDIVLVGNSTAPRAVDTEMLLRLLDRPTWNLARASVPGSGAATWYAVLKNLVYAGGHRPRLVLAPVFYEFLVGTGTFGVDSNVTDYMGAYEPLILQKTFGVEAGSPTWFQVETQRDRRRQALFDWLRNASVGLFHPDGPGTITDRGEALAMPALTSVFSAEGATDLTLHRNAIPIVQEQYAKNEITTPTRLQDSYLADVVQLVHENGGHFVVVLLPPPASSPLYSAVDAKGRLELVRYLNELGAGFIDLTASPAPDHYFSDQAHLNSVGRQWATERMAAGLLALDALEADTLPPARLPLACAAMERTGVASPLVPGAVERKPGSACTWSAPLPALGKVSAQVLEALEAPPPVEVTVDGVPLRWDPATGRGTESCDGRFVSSRRNLLLELPHRDPDAPPPDLRVTWRDTFPLTGDDAAPAAWIPPGTTARLRFDEPWQPEMGPFSVEVVGVPLTTSRIAPTLRVQGQEPVPFTSHAPWVVARTDADTPPTPPWTLEVASPPRGPLLLLRTVSLGDGERVARVFGTEQQEQGSTLWLVGLSSSDRSILFDHAAPPPDLPQAPARPLGAGLAIDLPDHAFLTKEALARTTDGMACDPVRLVVDDVMSRTPTDPCKGRAEPTSTCRAKQLFRILPGPATPVTARYRLALDPARNCRGRRGHWLYPGDTWTIRWRKATALSGFDQVGIRAVAAEGTGTDGPLHVVVRVQGKPVFEIDAPISTLRAGVTWDLGTRLPLNPALAEVQVSTPADSAWVVVLKAVLQESGVPDEPAEDVVDGEGQP